MCFQLHGLGSSFGVEGIFLIKWVFFQEVGRCVSGKTGCGVECEPKWLFYYKVTKDNMMWHYLFGLITKKLHLYFRLF